MLDPQVAATLDTHEANESEDELISALENDSSTDPTLTSLREKRLEQLHAEVTRAKIRREASHGTHQRLADEAAVLEITTSTKYVVVHFRKDGFDKCRFMDAKLEALAPRHFDTRFVSVNVDDAPFLVAKLDIRVLPCVFAFVDGVKSDRILGFEGLGRDTFTLQNLESRLLAAGVLVRPKVLYDKPSSKALTPGYEQDNDDDWD